MRSGLVWVREGDNVEKLGLNVYSLWRTPRARPADSCPDLPRPSSGICVGHLYYFFAVLYPLAGGRYVQFRCARRLLVWRADSSEWLSSPLIPPFSPPPPPPPIPSNFLRTPGWLHILLARSGLRGVQVDAAFARAAANGPRLFGGQGRRLGDAN